MRRPARTAVQPAANFRDVGAASAVAATPRIGSVPSGIGPSGMRPSGMRFAGQVRAGAAP